MTEREAFEGWARKRWPLYEIYWFRDEPRRCMAGTDRGRNSDSLGAHYMGWQAAAARYGPVVEAAAHLRVCDFAGTSIEFRCERCERAASVVDGHGGNND